MYLFYLNIRFRINKKINKYQECFDACRFTCQIYFAKACILTELSGCNIFSKHRDFLAKNLLFNVSGLCLTIRNYYTSLGIGYNTNNSHQSVTQHRVYNNNNRKKNFRKKSDHLILTFTSIAAPQNIHKRVYS